MWGQVQQVKELRTALQHIIEKANSSEDVSNSVLLTDIETIAREALEKR